ncbi:MAG TPA: hypothetical protein VMP89_02445, partial [Solirubrobacteraceae bacterium]|nr:hypothetical protein [Solirubrobacteraceae bacterium]
MTAVAWVICGAGVAWANTAASISAVEGQQLNDVVVDTVSSCSNPQQLTNVTIDWGDGTTSSGGTFETGTNSCGIAGSHTYAEEGSYVTDVKYTSAAGGPPNSDVGSAAVSDAQTMASGVNDFMVSDGAPLSAVGVADWSDPVPEPLTSYSATIDWGDGTANPGVIGSGTVSGSHTYANGGRFA